MQEGDSLFKAKQCVTYDSDALFSNPTLSVFPKTAPLLIKILSKWEFCSSQDIDIGNFLSEMHTQQDTGHVVQLLRWHFIEDKRKASITTLGDMNVQEKDPRQ